MNFQRIAGRAAFFCLLGLVIVASCRKSVTESDGDDSSGTDTSTDDGFVTNSKDTTVANAVLIKYTDSTVTVTNPFSASGVAVAITDRDVVVASTTTSTEVNYVLSGKTAKGLLKIYSDYKFGLVLNGVSIINDDGPAINIQSGKKVTVTLVGGTSNRLIDGSSYASSTEDQKAAFFSEGQLLFGGSGSLLVTGKYKHGICSDDYISVSGGQLTVVSAVSDGIHANDYFKMDGGQVTLTTSGDGLDVEEGYLQISGGGVTVNSVGDGITTSYDGTDAAITPYVRILGGTIQVTTTGEKGNAISSAGNLEINSADAITLKVSGNGAKGCKSDGLFTLTTGTVNITTSGNAFYDTDDADIAAPAGINCDSNLLIRAGSLTITSTGTGGKGITVDGTAVIDGGVLVITASGSSYTYSGSTTEAKGLKADGALTINEGNLFIAATDDGLKSETSITINGGTVNITKSTEGIEAPAISFNLGNVSVVSSDDCVNGTYGNGTETNDNSLISFTGGWVLLNSTGGDAIDGNGNIVMTGGTVVAQGPASQPELAIDVNGTFTISGGVLIGSGPNSGNMIEATSSSSAQYGMLVKINGNVAAGTLIAVQDASGNTLAAYTPARAAFYFVFSSAALQGGASYKIYTGGSYSGGTTINGYSSGGSYTVGSLRGTVTLTSKLTTASF